VLRVRFGSIFTDAQQRVPTIFSQIQGLGDEGVSLASAILNSFEVGMPAAHLLG
jgi:hypothetical protein